MKKVLTIMIIGMFMGAGNGMVFAGEKAPQKVVDLSYSTLVKLGTDPLVVKAVRAENARGKTLNQILKRKEAP